MNTLNDRERKILKYMCEEIKKKGYPPTVREMCNSLGIRSTSTAHKAIAALERNGFIRKDPSKPRAIEILHDASVSESYPPNVAASVTEIPVVGHIAAGTPILADENISDSLPIPNRYLSQGRYFMLTVRGDSMVEAGILDGDYILVRQQNTANNGEIVAAMIEDAESEATVKTFYKENGRIRLQPQNSSMEPIYADQVTILGLVKGVFRYLS